MNRNRMDFLLNIQWLRNRQFYFHNKCMTLFSLFYHLVLSFRIHLFGSIEIATCNARIAIRSIIWINHEMWLFRFCLFKWSAKACCRQNGVSMPQKCLVDHKLGFKWFSHYKPTDSKNHWIDSREPRTAKPYVFISENFRPHFTQNCFLISSQFIPNAIVNRSMHTSTATLDLFITKTFKHNRQIRRARLKLIKPKKVKHFSLFIEWKHNIFGLFIYRLHFGIHLKYRHRLITN